MINYANNPFKWFWPNWNLDKKAKVVLSHITLYLASIKITACAGHSLAFLVEYPFQTKIDLWLFFLNYY